MSIVNRYVLKQFLRYLIICLGISIFIYIVINLFDNLGKFLAKNATVLDILVYYLYLTPSYAILLIPVASMIAVFLVFGIMTKHREMLVLKTSGLSIVSLFYLFLITSVVIAAGTFVFQETVGVWAQARLIEHEQTKINRRPVRPYSWRRNFFYYGENNWLYYVRKFDARINTLDNVVLWQTAEDNRIKQRIDAPLGRYDDIWIFEGVTVRKFDTSGQEEVSKYQVLKMPELQEKPSDFLKRINVMEKILEPGAQVIQPRFASGRRGKAIFGTFAVTGKVHITIPAILRQGISLVPTEFHLLRRGHQLTHMGVLNVAQVVRRLDKMITGIQVPVVFEDRSLTAGLIQDTHPGGGHPQPVAH